MTARRLSLPEMLDALLERAARLRSAGVRRVELDGMAFDLDPLEGPAAPAQPLEQGDPDEDPALYGSRDGFVPGFPRLRERRRGMDSEE